MELRQIETDLNIKFKPLNERQMTWYAYLGDLSIIAFHNRKMLDMFESKSREKIILYINDKNLKAKSINEYTFKFVFESSITSGDLTTFRELFYPRY